MHPTNNANYSRRSPEPVDELPPAAPGSPVIQTAEVKIPNNAVITIYKMPEKLDDLAMHMKYLSEMVESFAQLLINGCIAALTWMSFQGAFLQNAANAFGPQLLETINKVTDLAKAQIRRPPQGV